MQQGMDRLGRDRQEVAEIAKACIVLGDHEYCKIH